MNRVSHISFALLFTIVACCFWSRAAEKEEDEEDKSTYCYVLKEQQVTVKKNGEMTVRIHNRIRIKKQSAIEYLGDVSIPYNSYRAEAKFITAWTETADGKKVEVDKNTVRDLPVAQAQNYNIYSDAKELSFSMPAVAVGAILDYEVEVETHRPVISGHAWDKFNFNEYVPVEEARYILKTPKKMNLTFDNTSLDVEPEVDKGWFSVTRKWELREPERLKYEYGMPPFSDIRMALRWTSVPDWQQIQDWYADLLDDRQGATDEMKAKIAELTKDCRTDREKVRALYVFLQDNFRYVGIELGRSAYEPHAAKDCFRNRYGDCKDQANLLVTMLREVGIQAQVALVRPTNDGVVRQNLPGPNQFNHAIVHCPLGEDTLWLDCTVKYMDEASHPASLDNANALIVGADGIKLKRIEPPAPESVATRRIYEIDLHHDGFTKVREIDECLGRSGAYARTQFRIKTEKERQEEVENYMKRDWSQAHLLEHGHSDPLDFSTPFREWVSFEGHAFFSATENGLTTQIGATDMLNYVSLPNLDPEPGEEKEERKYPFRRRSASGSETICVINLPPGMKLAETMAPFEVDRPEGKVIVYVKQEGDKIKAMAAAYGKPHQIAADELEAAADANEKAFNNPVRNCTLINEIELALKNKKSGQALERLQELLNAHPDDPCVHNLAGSVYSSIARPDSARAAYRKAISLDPGNLNYHKSLAMTYTGLGGYFSEGYHREKVLAIMKNAVETVRNKKQARLFLAQCCEFDEHGDRRSGKIPMDEAIAVYKEILKEDPEAADVMANIAECLFSEDKYEEAQTWFRKAAKEKGLDPDADSGGMVCSAFMGKPELAIKEIRESQLPPASQEQELRRIGSLLMKDRKYKESATLFNSVLESQNGQAQPVLKMLNELLAVLGKRNLRDYDAYFDNSTPESALRCALAGIVLGKSQTIRKTISPNLNMDELECQVMSRVMGIMYGSKGAEIMTFSLDLLEVIWKLERQEYANDVVKLTGSVPRKYLAFSSKIGQKFTAILEQIEGKWYIVSFGDEDPEISMLARTANSSLKAGDMSKALLYVKLMRETIGKDRGLSQDESVPALLCIQDYPSDECKVRAFVGFQLSGKRGNEAVDHLRFVQSKMPKNQVIKRALAEKCFQLARLTECCKLFAELTAEDPKNKRIIFNQMQALKQAQRYEEALKTKNKLASLIPSSQFIARVELELLQSAGRYKDGLALLRKNRGFMEKSAVWEKEVLFAGLLKDVDRIDALSKEIPSSKGFNNAGVRRDVLVAAYRFAGAMEKAMREQETQLVDNYLSASKAVEWALMLTKAGHYDDAHALVEMVKRSSQELTFLHGKIGRGALCLGDYEYAAKALARGAELQEGQERAYYNLFGGISYLLNGDKDAAQKLFLTSIDELGEGDWPRAHLRYLAGQISAEELSAAVATCEAEHDRAHRTCEQLYYQGAVALSQGMTDAALDFFQKAVDTGRTEAWEYSMSLSELQRRKK